MNLQLNIPFTQEDPLDKLTEELYRSALSYAEVQKMLFYIKNERAIKQDLINSNIEHQFRLAEANKRLLESTIGAQSGYFEYLTGGTEAENKAAEQRLKTVCQSAPKVIARVINDLQRERIIAENLNNLSLFVRKFNAHYQVKLSYDAFYSAFFTTKTKMRQKFAR